MNLALILAALLAPRLDPPIFTEHGGVLVGLQGQPNTAYLLESKCGEQPWELVDSKTAGAGGYVVFEDHGMVCRTKLYRATSL